MTSKTLHNLLIPTFNYLRKYKHMLVKDILTLLKINFKTLQDVYQYLDIENDTLQVMQSANVGLNQYINSFLKGLGYSGLVTFDKSYHDILYGAIQIQTIKSRKKHLKRRFYEKQKGYDYNKVHWTRYADTLSRFIANSNFTKSSSQILSQVGFKYFMWIPTYSKTPRLNHLEYATNIYEISNPPEGILPKELPNCKCAMSILGVEDLKEYAGGRYDLKIISQKDLKESLDKLILKY